MKDAVRRPAKWVVALALVASVGLVPLTSKSAAARVSSSSAPDCGAMIKKSTGGAWKCTFSDDFNGGSLDPAKWGPLRTYDTSVKTTECRVDTPQTIRVADGAVRLSALRSEDYWCETKTGGHWTDYIGGGIQSKGKFSQDFGRFEARMQLPASTEVGLHSAWWLWPEDTIYGASSGELDIAEWRSGLADRVAPALHYGDISAVNWHCYITDPTAWHTFAVEWTSKSMRFLYDGQLCWDTKVESIDGLVAPQPFDEPFFMILNQSIGVGLNAPTEASEDGTMVVDYVRVWK